MSDIRKETEHNWFVFTLGMLWWRLDTSTIHPANELLRTKIVHKIYGGILIHSRNFLVCSITVLNNVLLPSLFKILNNIVVPEGNHYQRPMVFKTDSGL